MVGRLRESLRPEPFGDPAGGGAAVAQPDVLALVIALPELDLVRGRPG